MALYDWNAIPVEQLNPSLTRQAIHSERMTVARLRLVKGVTVPEHHHHHEQISMVEQGALRFLLDGREQIVRAGEVLVIPPEVSHGVEVLEDTVVTDLFAPGREDWLRGDDAYLRR